jgi:hypothetical protein
MIISLKSGETSMPSVMYMMTFWTTSRYFVASRWISRVRRSALPGQRTPRVCAWPTSIISTQPRLAIARERPESEKKLQEAR